MKVKINSFHAVAVWKWNLAPPSALQAAKDAALLYEPSDDEDDDNDDDARLQEQEGAEQDDEDEDVCGICRVAFDGCCPDCKVPGDACPLVWGECTHIFHMHCLMKWINTEASKAQCPLDRRPWVTAVESQA